MAQGQPISKLNIERWTRTWHWIWRETGDVHRTVVAIRRSHFPGLEDVGQMEIFEADLAAAIDVHALEPADVWMPSDGEGSYPAYEVTSGPLSSKHNVHRITEGNFITWYDESDRMVVTINQMHFPVLSGGALNLVSRAITDMIDTWGVEATALPSDAETTGDGDVKAVRVKRSA